MTNPETVHHKQIIDTAVIPAAGFGTRFLPETKAIPKEMLPIVDKPVIQFVVEEAVESGIQNIVMVIGSGKEAIQSHFDPPNADLINNLRASNKEDVIKELQRVSEMANFIYIRQRGPYGNGTPVLCAEPIVGDKTFAVMWGDEFIYSKPPRLSQMMGVHEQLGGAVISGVRINKKADLSRYGIAEVDLVGDNVFKIKSIIEKPDPDKAPSNLATHGAYILPPDIFEILRNQPRGKGGELWLTDAIGTLIKRGYPVYACEINNGEYFDTGNKLEYLKTVVKFAMKHPEIGVQFKQYLKDIQIQ